MQTLYPAPVLRPTDHPVFTVPGCSLHAVSIDEMHTIDLGILQHLCGSLLWGLTYEGPLQGSPQERLLQIW
eukprot:10683316-Alexandrium_andersonii.AAC.1